MEENKVYYYLTPQQQRKFVYVVEVLKEEGYEVTKELQELVLAQMAKEGHILQLNAKQAVEQIKKVHGDTAKVLLIEDIENDDTE